MNHLVLLALYAPDFRAPTSQDCKTHTASRETVTFSAGKAQAICNLARSSVKKPHVVLQSGTIAGFAPKRGLERFSFIILTDGTRYSASK
ncbi:hypothetical protein ACQRIT_004410 [Beauveria bassiana]